MGVPVLSVDSKHFFFDLKQNERGAYLKIKEVCAHTYCCLFILLLSNRYALCIVFCVMALVALLFPCL
jgi:hypothetical protein